jgi:lycopene beta-cyclase
MPFHEDSGGRGHVSGAFDYVIVGGGLQGGLLSLALLARRPGATIAVVERDATLGGNHTWSFHEGDVPQGAHDWVFPLVAHRWPGYEVRFPALARAVHQSYASIPSPRLDAVVRERLAAAPGCALVTGATVESIGPREVRLADGRELAGRLVVDARGPQPAAVESAGYQKFVGLELALDGPRAPALPVVMDATVPQQDGFRFVYVLPLARDRVLVEDTYFSDSDALDRAALRGRCLAYAAGQDWGEPTVVREEHGVLPLPWRGLVPGEPRAPLVAGYAGGWFHPVTGYSFPLAVRLAALVASPAPEQALGPGLEALARRVRRQARFAHLLNWLMFRAYPPEARWHILERFYRDMPEATIRRFYALDLTWGDRARLLSGRPPRGLSLRRTWAHLQAA